MRREDLHMFFGLKWNPFKKDLPVDGMVTTPKISKFCWKVENLVLDGGFALITGGHGLGKSIALRILEDRLSNLREVQIGTLLRPQSGLSDFYREMGHHFGLDLNITNRWKSFKELRRKWQHHLESTLFHPVLLVDEAQEMPPAVLSELRFLSAEKFDSKSIITVIFSGDERLLDKFRCQDLQPLGSRISTRLVLEPSPREDLIAMLKGCLDKAGAPSLMASEVIDSLSDHAAGNPRIMMNMASELLMEAFKKEEKTIDEKIFFETFEQTSSSNQKKPNRKRRISNGQ